MARTLTEAKKRYLKQQEEYKKKALEEHADLQAEADKLGLRWTSRTTVYPTNRQVGTRFITEVHEGPRYRHMFFYPGSAGEAFEQPDDRHHYYLYIPGMTYEFYNLNTGLKWSSGLWLYQVSMYITRGHHREDIRPFPLPNASCTGGDFPTWPEATLADMLNEYWSSGFNLDMDISRAGFYGYLYNQTNSDHHWSTRYVNAYHLWEDMSPGEIIDKMSSTKMNT